MARKPKSTHSNEELGTDTSDDLLEDECPTPALTFRARVLYNRLLRIMGLPEGYPDREVAIQRHRDALTVSGHDVPETREQIEKLLREHE